MEDIQAMESPTVNGWTRAKNDQISTTYDASRQVELFKYIVYSPEYLQEGSCSSGNNANCNIYRSQDIANEPRIGKITNLNEIQRSLTNNHALGIKTSPDFSSGKPLDDDMLEKHRIMEPMYTYTSRVTDISADTQMNKRFMEDPRAPQYVPVLFESDEIRVSSRVQRRNEFAQSCPRR